MQIDELCQSTSVTIKLFNWNSSFRFAGKFQTEIGKSWAAEITSRRNSWLGNRPNWSSGSITVFIQQSQDVFLKLDHGAISSNEIMSSLFTSFCPGIWEDKLLDLHSKAIETWFYHQQPNYWNCQHFEIWAHGSIISCCSIMVQMMFSFPFCLPSCPYIHQRWCDFNDWFVLIKDGVTLMTDLYLIDSSGNFHSTSNFIAVLYSYFTQWSK